MKTKTSAPLSCRLVRWKLDLVHRDPQANRHVAGCPDCQGYFAFWADLERTARRTAPAWRETISPELQRRVRDFRAGQQPPAPKRRWFPLSVCAGVAAAVALAWWVWPPEPESMKLIPDDPVARLEVIAAARRNVPVVATLFPEVPGPGGRRQPPDRAVARAALANATVGPLASVLTASFVTPSGTRTRPVP